MIYSLGLMCIQFVDSDQGKCVSDRFGPRPVRLSMPRIRALHNSMVGDLMSHAFGIEQGGDIFENRVLHEGEL